MKCVKSKISPRNKIKESPLPASNQSISISRKKKASIHIHVDIISNLSKISLPQPLKGKPCSFLHVHCT